MSDIDGLSKLSNELQEWLANNGLPQWSADEVVLHDDVSEGQKIWLNDFIGRWNLAEEYALTKANDKVNGLIAEWNAWCKTENLPHGVVHELFDYDALSDDQLAWAELWISRYEKVNSDLTNLESGRFSELDNVISNGLKTDNPDRSVKGRFDGLIDCPEMIFVTLENSECALFVNGDAVLQEDGESTGVNANSTAEILGKQLGVNVLYLLLAVPDDEEWSWNDVYASIPFVLKKRIKK